MTNSGNLFADYLTEGLLEAIFIKYQCHISIYYKYAPDGIKIIVLYYVDCCFYWCLYESLGEWFVGTLRKILHVIFLGFSHWFVSIRISQMNDDAVSVDKAIYATSIVDKYIDTSMAKTSANVYNITFLSDMIFTKDYVSTSDEKF